MKGFYICKAILHLKICCNLNCVAGYSIDSTVNVYKLNFIPRNREFTTSECSLSVSSSASLISSRSFP